MPLISGSHISTPSSLSPVQDIVKHCAAYQGADTKRSVIQFTVTFALFIASSGLMLYGVQSGQWWITALLLLPTSGLLTRLFIFQHDCGHGSFFKTKKANDWLGRFIGILTVTPYDFWRRAHNMHHATSGDLDRRSIGGIDTVTVKEYKAMTPWKKFSYRLYRNPLVLLIFGTPYYTIIGQRLPFNNSMEFYDGYKSLPFSSIWPSVLATNIALVIFYGGLAMLFGWELVAFVHLPVLVVTAWIGGWLFYIQHQFEDAYWERSEKWDVHESALMGSSYYELHPVLQWFTGNIGLHHIHHLCLKIPNYKLQECLDARPELRSINRLTLRESLDCLKLKLWDEENNRLVQFSAIT